MLLFVMLSYKLFIFVIYFGNAAADFGAKDSANYGPYDLEYNRFEVCRGPKVVNLAEASTRLTTNEKGDYMGALNMTFYNTTKIEDMKMNVYSIKDNSKVLLWNYVINKPCQHYALGPLIETVLSATNCVVKKGFFTLNINVTETMRRFAGKAFFYGEYIFRIVVTSKKGNIICVLFDPKILKAKA